MMDNRMKICTGIALSLWMLAGSTAASGAKMETMEVHEGHYWHTPREAAARKNPVPADRASLALGKKLFETNCVVCHGATGRGDGPAAAGITPKPANLREMAGEHPDGDLAWKIANGRGPMPAWKGKLNEKQIWDVVNYLKSLYRADRKSGSQGGELR